MTEHPITPPPELVQQWFDDARNAWAEPQHHAATRAAQWGADQELEACCAELPGLDDYLRAARRPKLWSLKEQALAALEVIPKLVGFENERDTIRQALEALPND
jgi:hypothetical protein